MSGPTPETRVRARRWLESWERAGAALEDERARRLREMGPDDARQLTRDVLALWRPAPADELGAELVTHQRWFAAAARASRTR
jgi:hypothetical protein